MRKLKGHASLLTVKTRPLIVNRVNLSDFRCIFFAVFSIFPPMTSRGWLHNFHGMAYLQVSKRVNDSFVQINAFIRVFEDGKGVQWRAWDGGF